MGVPAVAVATSMTETSPLEFATYAFVPSGENATATGATPVGMVAVTALVVVSMTLTPNGLALLTTYAVLPSGLTATKNGAATGTAFVWDKLEVIR